jgi:hypothetical protein
MQELNLRSLGKAADTFLVLEVALYHSLGKLPEPESTHDFFPGVKVYGDPDV